MGYKKFFVGDHKSKIKIISKNLQKLKIRALFDSPMIVRDILRQLEPNSKLFKLEIEYLGSESFNS